jgi:alkylated DNA repair protein alkB homolog 6
VLTGLGDSLLITTDELYTEHLHGIAELTNDEDLNSEAVSNWHLLGSAEDFAAGRYDRQTRISLTYRDVLKVSNIGNSLKFLRKR